MDAQIREALQYCPSLPTLSSVAMRIVELGRDPEANIATVASVLSQDPALASRILRVSNSPLYAKRRSSNNLHQAVAVIGLNSALTLGLSFSLADQLRGTSTSPGALAAVWRRALIAATACRCMGEMLGRRDLEELFLAALLQDIGVLALEAALPERYGSLLAAHADHDELVSREWETLGTDHAAAGAWLMRYWGLPEYLATAAMGSHDPEGVDSAESLRPCVFCVALSGRVADLFLAHGGTEATERLGGQANDWLGLGGSELERLLDRVAERVPELEQLFETDIMSPRRAAGIVDEAREVLAVRNLQLISEVAEQHRRASDLERNSRAWRETASRDALTGLHNRRYMDERLESEFAMACEHGWPLAVGFLDLDYFKAVNDRHGHAVGDSVLVSIGEVLGEHLRSGDSLARYRGEEFVIVLPGTGAANAAQVFDRLLTAVEQHVHHDEHGTTFSVTASVGVAVQEGEQEVRESVEDLLRAADRALYDAKRAGRNCLRFQE